MRRTQQYENTSTLALDDMTLLMARAKRDALSGRCHAYGKHGMTGLQKACYLSEWKDFTSLTIVQGIANARKMEKI